MTTITFTQFRQSAKTYFDAVERGQKVRITRHGKAIAMMVPIGRQVDSALLWKKPALRLKVPGVSLSHVILKDRENSF